MKKFTLLTCMAILAGCGGADDAETTKAEALVAEQPMKHEGKITMKEREKLMLKHHACAEKESFANSSRITDEYFANLDNPVYLKENFGLTAADASDQTTIESKIAFLISKRAREKCDVIIQSHSPYGRCIFENIPKITSYENFVKMTQQEAPSLEKIEKACEKHLEVASPKE